MVKEVTWRDFEQVVLNSKRPVLLVFYNDNPASFVVDSALPEIARKYEGVLKICRMNADREPETVEMYHVPLIPACLLIIKGRVIAEMVGWNGSMALERIINKYALRWDDIV